MKVLRVSTMILKQQSFSNKLGDNIVTVTNNVLTHIFAVVSFVSPASQSLVIQVNSDMPPGTDCPCPIRILVFFEMIRPYHVMIRI